MSANRKYPDEVYSFIAENAEKYDAAEMAEVLNKMFGTDLSYKSVRWIADRNKIHLKRKEIDPCTYPQEVHDFIAINATKEVSYDDLTRMVNEKFGTDYEKSRLYKYCFRNGFRCGEGNKGKPSWMKGKEWEDVYTPEQMEKIKKNLKFQNDTPYNTMEVGTLIKRQGIWMIKTRSDGGYRENWQYLHRYVWENAYGKIPEGKIVIFKDGDYDNLSLDNLAVVSRGENAWLNTKGLSKQAELTDAAIAYVKLLKTIKTLKEGKNDTQKI